MAPHPKPGAKRDRDRLRLEMTDAGCDLAQIAMEMRVRFRMRPREAWRHAHGLTLQAAADRLNDLGGARPRLAVAADASLVGKWEKWPTASGRRPSLGVLALLAELYGCGVDDLLDFADRQELPPADLQLLRRRAPAPAQPADGPEPPAAKAPEPCGIELVSIASEESAAWARWAETTNVGDIALEQLLADTRAVADDYLSGEPTAVFRETRALRNRVFALLEGHQRPRQSADLYLLAGYLCGLLAWMSSDLGDMRRAETQGRTAWLCAEIADHNGLRAWTLSTRSKIALWDGRTKDAITLARRGAAYHPSGTAGVLLACQEADAWARLGATHQAQAALTHAAEAQAAQHGEDDIAGLFSCSDFRRVNYATGVHLLSGHAATALEEATSALATPPPHAYGTAAQLHITLACAHVALGDLDGAALALRPVLALAPEQRLAPVAERLREFARAIARSPAAGGRAASSLQEMVESWYLESAPRRLALSPGSLAD
ncbi:XRE family transcriptional regulator [Streptomyces kasugaensis]|uniref:XRE family transcriptional regulator n=1 Tax=Streptomyces kasugaensis TaxID=1946 RepID=UPI001F5FCD3E|nr:XRE family transcriptional regulator [Streptomyces kasugaensis]